ncbi:MAG: hypothetical protein A3J28_03400 [Acidobacteria bacterium RIFCSPLOWO2_12_FULL_60_22]|nr:MAG: hypothetical protein A3J28_03400 [Acidobacteria bacterium RIFCSPLOWO2_12_FULL_60_22]
MNALDRRFLAAIAAVVAFAATAAAQVVQGSSTPTKVHVRSGSLTLGALLWRPNGKGPFPAVLFNHGSARKQDRFIELLGPLFARHGYVFLFLYRRGLGLSVGQGTYSTDLLDRERTTNDQDAANRLQVRLLETDERDDALAAIAFLRALPEVDPLRVGLVGQSFGGSLALLVAERDSTLRAVIDFAGGAQSWERSPDLRDRLLTAVRRSSVPTFFIHAANDYSVKPGETLAAEMSKLGKLYRLHIFPPVGQKAGDGHGFIHLAPERWETEVFEFLDDQMRR